jgi:tripartite ATP-independent transporter DctM subunit
VEIKKPLWQLIEDWTCNAAIILLAIIPATESFLRLFFHSGVPFSQDIIKHLLLVTGCISGMIATRQKEHLSIGLIHYIKNKKIKTFLSILANLLSSYTALILTFCSAVYVKIAVDTHPIVGFISAQTFAFVLPVCFAVMSVRFAMTAPLNGKKKLISLIPVIIGLICSFPVILKFIYGVELPDYAYEIDLAFSDTAKMIEIPLIIFFILLAFAGTPLFIVIGAFSILLFEASGGEIDEIIVNASTSLTNRDFIAIPLFTLVGFFLSESNAGKRLVETFKRFFGWFPGGLIFVSVTVCAFFTTFTGASGITILALGGLLFTILSENAKYPIKFSRGILASSGSIGLLFPPSLPLILVAITMQKSILGFFAAGAIPGIILTLSMIIFGIFVSVKTKIPVEKFSIKGAVLSLKNSIFELLLPFLLLGGYFSGILSLIETGAAAFLYIFIVEVFIIRDIKLSDVPRVFEKALPIIGGILSILALSKALSEYIVLTQAPENFAAWLQQTVRSKLLFLFILNIALLLAGCLMDIFSATVVLLPLIAPLGAVYGIDPFHLGIIFLVNLEAGYITPPVGLNLFLASYRFDRPFVEICHDVLPFLVIQIIVVFLVTYIPVLSTFLPGFF